jgi:hypothetical protein
VEIAGGPLDAASQIKDLASKAAAAPALVTLAFCWPPSGDSGGGEAQMFHKLEAQDGVNLSLALRCSDDAKNLLVFQTRQRGFSALFPLKGQSVESRLNVFGVFENVYSTATLMHEDQDTIAKELHEDYCQRRIALNEEWGSRPSLNPWPKLTDYYKDSNRHAADHIPVKLRAIGYKMDRLRNPADQDKTFKMTFTPEQVELLAKMEHERWRAERLLLNETANIHQVSWDELTQLRDPHRDWNPQELDRSQEQALPRALANANYGIYPQGSPTQA